MNDPDRENRKLWDEWSDQHQALWNAETDEGGFPPVYSPLPDPESLAEWQAERLPDREDLDFVELGCGGGQGTVGTASEGIGTAVGVDFSLQQLRHATRFVFRWPLPYECQSPSSNDVASEVAPRMVQPATALAVALPTTASSARRDERDRDDSDRDERDRVEAGSPGDMWNWCNPSRQAS